MATGGTFQIPRTFVHLGPDGTSVPLEVTETFWSDLASGAFASLGPGRLVSCLRFEADWASWEVHPAGEELVVLLAGSLDFVLELPGGHETRSLREPGDALVVPRDTWHTVRVRAPSTALFVTAGEGTQHRPGGPEDIPARDPR